MVFEAKYKLKTSTFHPFVGDGMLRPGIGQGKAVHPTTIEDVKRFKVDTEEEAIRTAQYIGYHMARVINPHEFSSEDNLGFSEVFLVSLIDKISDKELEIPKPGDHFADSALRKELRGNGEDHFVEIVGMNSDLLYPNDYLSTKGKRKEELDYTKTSPELETFFEKYFRLMQRARPHILVFPVNGSVVMISYSNEMINNLNVCAKAGVMV